MKYSKMAYTVDVVCCLLVTHTRGIAEAHNAAKSLAYSQNRKRA